MAQSILTEMCEKELVYDSIRSLKDFLIYLTMHMVLLS